MQSGMKILAVIVLLAALAAGCISPPLPPPATVQNIAATQAPIDASWQLSGQVGGSPQLPDLVAVVNQVRPSVVAINVQVPSANVFGGAGLQQGAAASALLSPLRMPCRLLAL